MVKRRDNENGDMQDQYSRLMMQKADKEKSKRDIHQVNENIRYLEDQLADVNRDKKDLAKRYEDLIQ